MQKGFWKDISVIEISIIFAIVGSIIAVTWPHFEYFQCSSKQSEAKFLLSYIYSAQKLHEAQLGEYTTLEELLRKHRIALSPKYYHFSTGPGTNARYFEVKAEILTGKNQGDAWSIDQDNNLININNMCK